MTDVFGASLAVGGDFLRAAAIDAAYELGVVARLRAGPATLDELADAIGVGAGRRRLRPLCDVLAAIGAIARVAPGEDRFTAAARRPPREAVVREGWGRLAQVIRDDRPLPAPDDEVALRYQRHLLAAGAEAARELAPLLGRGSLLDLGSGAGAYSAAFLDGAATTTATLCDGAPVLALAREELARFGDRARFVAGDARTAEVGTGYGAVLLANLLHLHDAATCAALCVAAAAAVAGDGMVVVKDLRLDEDRSGPAEGLYFALNMAVYTDGGDVHRVSQIRAWLAAAGLGRIAEHTLATSPESVVLVARK